MPSNVLLRYPFSVHPTQIIKVPKNSTCAQHSSSLADVNGPTNYPDMSLDIIFKRLITENIHILICSICSKLVSIDFMYVYIYACAYYLYIYISRRGGEGEREKGGKR